MQPADLERVMDIEHASYSTPWARTTFEGLLKRADVDALVAVVDGGVAGYAISWTVLDQAEIGNIAVAGEYRRRGVARTLMHAILDRQRSRGVRHVFLEVRESNDAAQRLYRQFGFRAVGTRRHYYSQPSEDAIVMSRRLDVRS